MKTSTKNVIISGIFTISAAIIGTISYSIGKEKQDNKIETTINQSGVITINQSENSIDTIERLLDEYISLQKAFNDINVKYVKLKNDYDNILSYNENANSLNVSLEEINQNQELIQNNNATEIFDATESSEEIVNLTTLIDVGLNNHLEPLSETYSMDSYGNSYKTGYNVVYSREFDQISIAKYRLNGEYNQCMGSMAYCMNAYKEGYIILNFYDENDNLLYKTDKADYNTEYFDFNFSVENVKILKITYEGKDGNIRYSLPRIIIPYLQLTKWLIHIFWTKQFIQPLKPAH